MKKKYRKSFLCYMKKLVAILIIFLASVFLFLSCAKQPSEMEYWIYLYGMAESDASVSDDKTEDVYKRQETKLHSNLFPKNGCDCSALVV